MAAVEAAERRLTASLDKAVRNGKLEAEERDAILKRVRFTDTLDELADCDLITEAAIENEKAKTAIFSALGEVVRPDALLTSNTSSIPIMKLAAATPNPERVLGMHFFNPAPVLPLVEVIPCELTSVEIRGTGAASSRTASSARPSSPPRTGPDSSSMRS